MFSKAEENYLKAIYSLSTKSSNVVSTNDIAEKLCTKASSVTDMIKKLADKKLVNYTKYHGTSLTKKGLKISLVIVRKHRLWETFLVEKLHFKWTEVHELAEQLEHIKSDELVNRLDAFLEHPTHDPHGDPIPNEKGILKQDANAFLSAMKKGVECVLVGVKDSSDAFLKYLDTKEIALGNTINVLEIEPFDNSMQVIINNKTITISKEISNNLLVN